MTTGVDRPEPGTTASTTIARTMSDDLRLERTHQVERTVHWCLARCLFSSRCFHFEEYDYDACVLVAVGTGRVASLGRDEGAIMEGAFGACPRARSRGPGK